MLGPQLFIDRCRQAGSKYICTKKRMLSKHETNLELSFNYLHFVMPLFFTQSWLRICVTVCYKCAFTARSRLPEMTHLALLTVRCLALISYLWARLISNTSIFAHLIRPHLIKCTQQVSSDESDCLGTVCGICLWVFVMANWLMREFASASTQGAISIC